MSEQTNIPVSPQDPFGFEAPVSAEISGRRLGLDIWDDAASIDSIAPVEGPGALQRIKDRFSRPDEATPESFDFDAPLPTDEPAEQDIWNDWARQAEQENPTLFERIRSHRKVVAAVTALALLGGAGATVAKNTVFADRTPAVAEAPEQPKEAQAEKQQGEILDHPIRPRSVIEREEAGTATSLDIAADEIPESIAEYHPKFLGAYRTKQGLAFNVYGATQPGQEADLSADFKVNPESLDFIVDTIANNMPNAPETPSKQAILQSLQQIKSGEKERIIDLVVDVSQHGGCLDAQSQLIRFTEALCAQGGVTDWPEADLYSKGPAHPLDDRVPVVVGAGAALDPAVVEQEQAAVVLQPGESFPTPEEMQQQVAEQAKKRDEGMKADAVFQTSTAMHEVVHAVGDPLVGGLNKPNTYAEGDSDHEITGWLLGQNQDQYDLAGAQAPSPDMIHVIEKQIKDGTLRPIVEVADSRK